MKNIIETANKGKIDQEICFVLFGLFAAPIFIREMLFPFFYQMNFLAFLGCLYILSKALNGSKIQKVNFIPYVLILTLLMILIVSEFHAHRTFKGFIRVFIGLIMPLPLLFYKFRNPRKTIHIIVKVFNTVALVILVMGLLDFLFEGKIISRYYMLAHDTNYYNMAISSKRLYSYVGHPLYNAEIFLISFGLNYVYNEILLGIHKNDKWIILISLLGITMTASKSGIAIFLGMLIVLYVRKIKYMVTSMIMLTVGYVNGLFDYVLERFSGSLTTGRNEVWERISSSGIQFFHFLWGNGSDSKYKYSYLEEWARAAFEYPYRLFALEFGILFSGIMMFTIFLLPSYKIIRNNTHGLLLLFVFGAVALHVNMYNGIGTYSDLMYTFCLFGCAILNISGLGRKNT